MRVALAAMLSFLALAALSPLSAPSLAAQTRAIPRVDSTVPFKVGETLTFDVSWSGFVVAGTAVASVRERRPSAANASAYYIVAEGRPLPLIARLYSIYYKMDTLLDTATLLPQEGSLYSEEGKRQRMGTTRYDRTARKAFFEPNEPSRFSTMARSTRSPCRPRRPSASRCRSATSMPGT
jgi:hypothetical protein